VYLPADAGEGAVISAIPDARILAFTLGVMFVTGIFFGLAPAIHSARADVAPTLKDQAGSVAGGGNVWMRKLLVAAQVTLSLLLLIGAGLFLRTLANLRNLGPGFSPKRLIGFNVDPSLNAYSDERTKTFYQRLTEDLSATPGVSSVALASVRILDGDEWDSSMTVEGYSPKPGQGAEPYMNSIGPQYFETLGIPVVEGREFTLRDTQRIKHGPDPDDFSPTAVMINESFAKKFFPGRSPIGLHLGFGSDPGTKTDMEIIGVVKDVKYTNLRDDIPVQAYIPYLAGRHFGGMTVYVRTSLDPKQLMSQVRYKVHQLDPNVPVFAMRTIDEQVDLSLRNERLVASLSTVFGMLATLLATIGLYGVMAYTVARRTREIGIRMALGAQQHNVIWIFMREVLVLIAAGVLVGLPLSIALGGLIRNQLFGLAPHDPLTMFLSTFALIAVASFAGFVPALRASRVDPTRALRFE
ncbi:MAG: FtsX-like permease family protein, partial [Bryobacteraceae bacterium]